MSKENQKTLEIYGRYYGEFLASLERRRKVKGDKKIDEKIAREAELWDSGFKVLPRPARILEIGSGSGVEAKALAKLGYEVTPSDVVEGFLSEIRKNGLNPIKYNVLTDKLEGKYDGVLAWHVFVHFTKEDTEVALENLFEVLNPGGRLIFDVKSREEKDEKTEEWIDYGGDYHMGVKRFFRYYSEREIREMVSQAGFEVISFEKYKSSSGVEWLRLVVEKPN